MLFEGVTYQKRGRSVKHAGFINPTGNQEMSQLPRVCTEPVQTRGKVIFRNKKKRWEYEHWTMKWNRNRLKYLKIF